ncbi:hypothetical protein T492DRAFT_1109992 [Pavlovales sp. CCMP2436]|nr:hypothetical protein T492DRAFT_1109992 [Pavlovales sp. CCMP2436]
MLPTQSAVGSTGSLPPTVTAPLSAAALLPLPAGVGRTRADTAREFGGDLDAVGNWGHAFAPRAAGGAGAAGGAAALEQQRVSVPGVKREEVKLLAAAVRAAALLLVLAVVLSVVLRWHAHMGLLRTRSPLAAGARPQPQGPPRSFGRAEVAAWRDGPPAGRALL